MCRPSLSPRTGLLARGRALVRRATGKTGTSRQAIEIGALEVDPGARAGSSRASS